MNDGPNKKRNMELIRALLLWIEAQPAGALLRTIEAPEEYTRGEVLDHLRIVYNAGLLDGNVRFHSDDAMIAIHGLSNDGHDLLNAIRNDTIWAKTKEKLKEVGGDASIDTLKAVATALIAKVLGIQ